MQPKKNGQRVLISKAIALKLERFIKGLKDPVTKREIESFLKSQEGAENILETVKRLPQQAFGNFTGISRSLKGV